MHRYVLVCFFTLLRVGLTQCQEAVIIVPVADLIGQPLVTYNIKPYRDFPLCPRQLHNRYNGCPRLHQSLYNERVKLIKIVGDEGYIDIPQLFYISNNQKQTKYWIYKDNIRTIAELKKKGVDTAIIPTPIAFDAAHKSVHNDNQNIVTLVQPWYDAATQRTFSAGTRFVMHKTLNTSAPYVEVYVLDPNTLRPCTMHIDKKICLFNTKKSASDQRALFIKIAKAWAHMPDCFIPYVWGGSSFTSCSRAEKIEEQKKDKNDACFALADYHASPKTGFDCAGLVSRAAQMAGIPYFYKNTSTLSQELKPITRYKDLQNGDLLWIPGHVMIISDIANARLIEARGYHHGYGKVQEIALSKVFKDIKSFAELFNALHAKKSITRLDKEGNPREEISNYKFLSLTDSLS